MIPSIGQCPKKGEYVGRMIESTTLSGIQELSEDSTPAHQNKAKPIEIDRDSTYSVVFLADGNAS